MKILHVTPHLGGGVGTAIVGIIKQTRRNYSASTHTIATLEPLEKVSSRVTLGEMGVVVHENAPRELIRSLAMQADIVQIEFWNHPLLPEALFYLQDLDIRIVCWCHISGTFFPTVPFGLVDEVDRFICTADFSRDSLLKRRDFEKNCDKTSVIKSSGGFDRGQMNRQGQSTSGTIKTGYIGTLSYAKLTPDYCNYIDAARDQLDTVEMYGDTTSASQLVIDMGDFHLERKIFLRGYAHNISEILSDMDIFLYLLNPMHYGTGENSLIEAMSFGVIPIVLPNACELDIVTSYENGIVISRPEELAPVIETLRNNLDLRMNISENAIKTATSKYSFNEAAAQFESLYSNVIKTQNRRTRDFARVFGKTPRDWAASFRPVIDPMFRNEEECILIEKYRKHIDSLQTKGSRSHFRRYYPNHFD